MKQPLLSRGQNAKAISNEEVLVTSRDFVTLLFSFFLFEENR